jgi:pimeloyl-ACP methyl ester carboxylesterase
VLVLEVLAAIVALGLIYQQLGLRRDRLRFPPPGAFVDAPGCRLHALISGQGRPAVVLESAIAASSVGWSVVRDALETSTRVAAYDRAGLGWSEPASGPRTFGRIVDELAAVVAHVDERRPCVLVGHSFGSLIVRACAARHPELVAGIVLVDPPTEWLTMTPLRQRMLRGGRPLATIGVWLARVGVVRLCLALLTGGAPGAPRNFVRIFGPTTAQTLERLVGEVRKLPTEAHPVVQALWCQPKCFRAMGDYISAMPQATAALRTEVLPSALPVVVISSGNQPPGQLAVHRELAEGSSAGRHVVAPQSAHWVQWDQPDLVADVVRDLVESLRRASAD